MNLTDRHKPTRALHIAAAAMCALAACSLDAARGCGCNPRPDDISVRAPQPWSADADRSVDVTISEDRGVGFRTDQHRVQLFPPGQNVNWTNTEWEDLYRIQGQSSIDIDGASDPAQFRVRLLFAPGNPQVHVSTRLTLPAGARPESRMALSIRFPAGDHWHRATAGQSSSVSPPIDIPGWRYPWLQYAPEQSAPVTLFGWTGDGVRLRQKRGEHATLSLIAWRPTPAPPCNHDEISSRTIQAHATLAFSDTPPITISRLPAGASGAVVPVFLPPKSANNPSLWRGGPENATDWEERLRTLAYGHSYSEDPRFGNGGLLGNDLGASLTWPASLFDAEAFSGFRTRISSTPLDLAAPLETDLKDNSPDKQSQHKPEVRTALTLPGDDTLPACPSNAKQLPDVIVRDGPTIDKHLPTPLSPNPSVDEGFITAPTAQRTVVASIAHTDGTRPPLTDSLLSQKTVDRIAEHREVLVLGIPLIATRNPLRPAADHGLLSPERDHQWTLQGDFSSSLTTLNLAADATGIDVLGIGPLVEHWRRARRVELRWTKSGRLDVRNPGDFPVREFTLMAPGAAPTGPDDLSKRTVGNGSAATWRLPADDSQAVNWPDDATPTPSPVQWQVE